MLRLSSRLIPGKETPESFMLFSTHILRINFLHKLINKICVEKGIESQTRTKSTRRFQQETCEALKNKQKIFKKKPVQLANLYKENQRLSARDLSIIILLIALDGSFTSFVLQEWNKQKLLFVMPKSIFEIGQCSNLPPRRRRGNVAAQSGVQQHPRASASRIRRRRRVPTSSSEIPVTNPYLPAAMRSIFVENVKLFFGTERGLSESQLLPTLFTNNAVKLVLFICLCLWNLLLY
ncbi:hypothetical protein LXL04_039523 [Taraxacum kok-saghyz]